MGGEFIISAPASPKIYRLILMSGVPDWFAGPGNTSDRDGFPRSETFV